MVTVTVLMPTGVGVTDLTRDAAGDRALDRYYPGAQVSRACTSDESVVLTRAENAATLRGQVGDSLTVLRTSVDTLQAITDKANANIGPADTKAVAREARRVARQVLALSRLFVEALESTDTGSA